MLWCEKKSGTSKTVATTVICVQIQIPQLNARMYEACRQNMHHGSLERFLFRVTVSLCDSTRAVATQFCTIETTGRSCSHSFTPPQVKLHYLVTAAASSTRTNISVNPRVLCSTALCNLWNCVHISPKTLR